MRLSDRHRQFIVERLAAYRSPLQVVADVRQEFGIEVTRHQVRYYDPCSTPARRAGLSPRWAELFRDARDMYLSRMSAPAIEHRIVRLQMLQQLLERAMEAGDVWGQMIVLKAAAREGDATARRDAEAEHSQGPRRLVLNKREAFASPLRWVARSSGQSTPASS